MSTNKSVFIGSMGISLRNLQVYKVPFAGSSLALLTSCYLLIFLVSLQRTPLNKKPKALSDMCW